MRLAIIPDLPGGKVGPGCEFDVDLHRYAANATQPANLLQMKQLRVRENHPYNVGVSIRNLVRAPNKTAGGEGNRHILLRGLRKLSQSPAILLGASEPSHLLFNGGRS